MPRHVKNGEGVAMTLRNSKRDDDVGESSRLFSAKIIICRRIGCKLLKEMQ